MGMTAATDTRLEVTPLSGWTGALISGVDLSSPLSGYEVKAIRDALHTWKVVFFHDQTLDHAAQIAFGAQDRVRRRIDQRGHIGMPAGTVGTLLLSVLGAIAVVIRRG